MHSTVETGAFEDAIFDIASRSANDAGIGTGRHRGSPAAPSRTP
jgi:hypothetical protein